MNRTYKIAALLVAAIIVLAETLIIMGNRWQNTTDALIAAPIVAVSVATIIGSYVGLFVSLFGG